MIGGFRVDRNDRAQPTGRVPAKARKEQSVETGENYAPTSNAGSARKDGWFIQMAPIRAAVRPKLGMSRPLEYTLGRFFGKDQPEWAGTRAKISAGAPCRASAAASRGGCGALYERQPPTHTQNIDAGGLGGRPTAYAAVRLDVVVVQYGHAEYQRLLLVYAAGVPEAGQRTPR